VSILELIQELVDAIKEVKPKEIFASRSKFLMDIFKKAVNEFPIVVPYLTSLKVNLK
jgi:metal-responsive CopG/Arc/MetJ family transcriptional regulator